MQDALDEEFIAMMSAVGCIQRDAPLAFPNGLEFISDGERVAQQAREYAQAVAVTSHHLTQLASRWPQVRVSRDEELAEMARLDAECEEASRPIGQDLAEQERMLAEIHTAIRQIETNLITTHAREARCMPDSSQPRQQ